MKNSITPTITPVLHKKVLLYAEIRTERRYQQVSIFGQEMTGFLPENILQKNLEVSGILSTFAPRFL